MLRAAHGEAEIDFHTRSPAWSTTVSSTFSLRISERSRSNLSPLIMPSCYESSSRIMASNTFLRMQIRTKLLAKLQSRAMHNYCHPHLGNAQRLRDLAITEALKKSHCENFSLHRF